MSQRALNRYVQQEFSEIVEWFVTQYCRVDNGLSISDKTIFPVFRAFWMSTATETQHPALLGQFRAELAQRGFRPHGPKRPRWYALTLHRLTVLSDQADTEHIDRSSTSICRCSLSLRGNMQVFLHIDDGLNTAFLDGSQ